MENRERMTQKVFSNGDVYFGDFKGTLPHGKGRYIWSDGRVYEGDWEEGKMTGEGQVLWSSGATYEGNLCAGYLHGFGTFTGPDGSVYSGSWRWNIQNGIGRKQYHNYDIYDGYWKEGVQEGSGTYAWSNGNMYTGKWKGGKMCGRGVMKWLNGDFFDGFWLNGFRHGSGFYSFADGCYYFGTWTKGLKDGQGIFYPPGSKCPSITKWFSFDGEVDKRSLFEKISKNVLIRGPGRMSHRNMSMKEDRNPGDAARDASSCETSIMLSHHTSKKGQGEVRYNTAGVFEREYMQGVLIKERVRNKSGLTKNKLHGKFLANDVNKRSFLGIIERHKSYYLMLNLQLGIRYTVGKITPVPMREVRYSDFEERARINMYFPRVGSQLTPPHYSIDFYWKDYCPMVFRNLREMFNLDAADYMMSICGDDGLREISSPGKSGSIFYLSHDDRFVIKTLRKSELKVLLKMLPSYYDHVKDHENTLITKFFGVHRITWRSGKKVRFVVMGNMFYTELRIHRRYDLKGSYQGRFTNKDEIDENTTLKDLDLSYEFPMDKSLRESLFKQISLDCLFLESQHILDYSLLLGLHFRAPEHLKALLDPPNMGTPENTTDGSGAISQGNPLIPAKGLVLVTHEPSSVSTAPGPHIRGNNLRAFSIGDEEVDLLLPGTGRLRVQLGVNMPAQANHKLVQDVADATEVELFETYDVVLYLGIIDILQDYNMKKKLEHAYKSLQFDPLSISAVEPNLYSRRFIAFLDKVFLVKP